MCAPLVLAIASVAGSAASYAGNASAASRNNRLARQVSEQNSELARRNAINEYGQLNQRQIEEQTKAFQQIEQITNETRNAIGEVQSSAAAVNIKGQSVEDLLNNFKMNEFNNITTVNQNQSFIRQNIASDKASVRLGLQSRLLASLPDYQRPPNLVANIFQAGTSAAGAYMSAGGKFGSEPNPQANPGIDATPDYSPGPVYES